jgi:DNA invertase Pin-like site-specific DNA recombinase
MQLRELREHCQRRGWEIVGEYVDVGISGSKDSRPQLNRLVADAHRRKLDGILVWKLDRFGRSLKHLVNALAEFESLGVAFISLKESLDLTTPSGRLMFGIISAMAEFERDLIRERVRAGIANRRAKGLRVGRKPIVLDAGRLATMRSEGLTIREIATELACSPALVHKTLQIPAA